MGSSRDRLIEQAADYLEALAGRFPDRSVGSPGNRAATALFAETAASHGFQVSRSEFECLTWDHGDATLEVAGERPRLHVGPYSTACDLSAPLSAASRVEDLESETVRGTVAIMHGDLARGQLMPRNFPFYNPESHQRVYRALDTYAPAAVLTTTGRDPHMVGSMYPFNLFEDGDFHIPHAYLTDVEGGRLLTQVGSLVHLRIDSRRLPSTAEHVVATQAGGAAPSGRDADPGRIVLFAHIDSRRGSPGAIDNATGVAVLLTLAALLRRREGGPTVDLVPVNGEDDYANPGERHWLAQNQGRMEEIVLGVNIDDAGRRGQDTHVSFYDVPADIETVVRSAMAARPAFAEGPKWVMGDHSLFAMHGRPAIAVASSDMEGFMAEACHTERDTVALADPAAVIEIARFLRDVITGMA